LSCKTELGVLFTAFSLPHLYFHLSRGKSLPEQSLCYRWLERDARQASHRLPNEWFEEFTTEMFYDGVGVEDCLRDEEGIVSVCGIKVAAEEKTNGVFPLLWELHEEGAKALLCGRVELGKVIGVLSTVGVVPESIERDAYFIAAIHEGHAEGGGRVGGRVPSSAPMLLFLPLSEPRTGWLVGWAHNTVLLVATVVPGQVCPPLNIISDICSRNTDQGNT
jgi:hypothetical protein